MNRWRQVCIVSNIQGHQYRYQRLFIFLTWCNEAVHLNEHLALLGERPGEVALVELGGDEDAAGGAPRAAGVVYIDSADEKVALLICNNHY